MRQATEKCSLRRKIGLGNGRRTAFVERGCHGRFSFRRLTNSTFVQRMQNIIKIPPNVHRSQRLPPTCLPACLSYLARSQGL